MKNLFAFKKLSTKITAFVMATVILVAGCVAAYMQMRIMSRTDQYSREKLSNQTFDMAGRIDSSFIDAVHKTESLRSLAESLFDANELRADPQGYIDSFVSPVMGGFVYNIIDRSDYITAAYFALHPDLAGVPFVCEIYYSEEDGRIVPTEEVEDYEDYRPDNEDMEWFYGAYTSNAPYWTHVYDYEGIEMVSYVEPVNIRGERIGVAGVDIPIGHIENLIKDFTIEGYDTGFALLRDRYGRFFKSDGRLSEGEKDTLAAARSENNVFQVKLGGVKYMVSEKRLANGYSLYILIPKNEFDADAMGSLRLFITIFPFVIAVIVLLSITVGKSISKPIAIAADAVDRLAAGEFSTDALNPVMDKPDETGTLARAVLKLRDRLSILTDELNVIAKGDLSGEITLAFAGDQIGGALNQTLSTLNDMFGQMNQSSDMVGRSARQIADGSQVLAQGAARQTQTIEHLSSMVSGIAQKTKDNADLAGRAASLANTIKGKAETGSNQMGEMIAAVDEINQASQDINKVIKVIDDIAFQTNILALNAAVEAARAGQHGKGFAVVAEEVRNLAGKSAEAAKDTGVLISNSVDKAELGVRIAHETSSNFTEIVGGINESSQIINEIAQSSEAQMASINQINTGIDQVAQGVQQNASAAEESAAASEEMSGQSDILQQMISRFKLKGGGNRAIGGGLPRY
jgi:methyl-accepting chemotaxis protein